MSKTISCKRKQETNFRTDSSKIHTIAGITLVHDSLRNKEKLTRFITKSCHEI